MKNTERRLRLLAVLGMMVSLACCSTVNAQVAVETEISFKITLSEELDSEPVSGRLLLFFSKGKQPMNGPNWFRPEPFFGKDVENVGPGDSIELDQLVAGFPGSFDDIESGPWNVQAVLDHDFHFADHKNGAGNFFSDPVAIEFQNRAENGVIDLQLKHTIAAKEIKDTETFKLVTLKSRLLSDFHGRQVVERAGVVLPESYASSPDKRYPVSYIVTGFGGTLDGVKKRFGKAPRVGEGEVEFIRVYLTGQCKWGHHVYADSATNGPRGEAFVSEMIPLIDSKFRTIAEPTARFVGGHSSGGWSSLWLQVSYPSVFGGCWSTAPDPVDFRDWQGSEIYNGESVFFEADGKTKKPLARMNRRVLLWYPDFCRMDDTLGRGGQLRSFEAVFSPLGEDGLPREAWDRETGTPVSEVVEYWKRYDIGLILQNRWSELKGQLAGKIHVYMGDVDTFYLDEATRLLGERVSSMGIDAKIEMFPNKDHMNLLDPTLRRRIRQEMSAKFLKSHSEQ